MKRVILLLLVLVMAAACCACGRKADEDLIGMKYKDALQAVNGTDLYYHIPDVWRVEDGFLVIYSAFYQEAVRSVAHFSKEGELVNQINVTALTDADPSQWPGMTTQALYARLGQPHYDVGVGFCERPTAAYLTAEGKLCYFYILDDRVTLVRVCDLFSDETAVYPSGAVELAAGTPVTLICRDAEHDIEERLSDEEAAQIIAIFDGKERYSDIPAEPLCGFEENYAFRIGERTFCPACDSCRDAMEYETGLILDLTQEERDTIDAIYAAHGGRFPYQ